MTIYRKYLRVVNLRDEAKGCLVHMSVKISQKEGSIALVLNEQIQRCWNQASI